MAQLIDKTSQIATKSELDLFSVPPTQVVIESSNWVPVFAKNSIKEDSQGPFEFTLERDFEYLDLSNSYMHIQLSITKAAGTNIAEQDPPADDAPIPAARKYEAVPINNIGSSMFKTLKVFFNSRLVYDSGPTYALRSYIEDTLNYSTLTKNTMLQSAGYFPDTFLLFDSMTNKGYQQRGKMADKSRKFDILAPIHADCFSHDRLLLSNMQVRLEAYKNPDAYCIQSLAIDNNPEQYKLKIHNMTWLVRKVQLLSSMSLALEARLAKQVARYPIRRVTCRDFHINGNIRTVSQLQLSQGQLPRRIVLGMLDVDSFHGNYKSPCFEFKNNKVEKLQLIVGGVPIPRLPLECNFKDNQYTRAYMSMFSNLNNSLEDNSNGITYRAFAYGYTFFVFDLSSDNSETWHLVREGTVTLDMSFGIPTPANGIKLIVCYEMENLMMINKNRETYFDFSQ